MIMEFLEIMFLMGHSVLMLSKSAMNGLDMRVMRVSGSVACAL